MYQQGMRKMLLLLLAVFLLAQGAAAAEGTAGKQEPKYKKVSGEVVSIGQDNIVIKSRTKGNMKLAITKTTDMEGQVKAGDRATVNYRVDEKGSTATRISPKTAPGKTGRKQTAALAAGSGSAR